MNVKPQTTALLDYIEKQGKWVIRYAGKVIIRSRSKEYAVAMVLDGVNKKVQELGINRLVDIKGEEINYIRIMRESTLVKRPITFKKMVNKSIEHRRIIDNDLNEDMRSLRDLFSKTFLVEKIEFTQLKDFMYYKGGWPSIDSPARLDTLFKSLSVVMKYFKFMEMEEELIKYMKNYGLTISIDDAKVEQLTNYKDPFIKQEWRNCFGKEVMPESKQEIAKKILDKALVIQEKICGHADQIKIINANVVEDKCGVKRSNFVNAVNSAFKVSKTGLRRSSALYHTKIKHVVSEAAMTRAIEKDN